MKKKIVGILVCILLIGTVLPVSGNIDIKNTSIPPLSGITLYVGGSGPNNYTYIQSAIDDANDSDTIYVYDDGSPYYENIQIDKSISLIGEDRNTTVIDANGGGNVILISSDEVKIQGFTLQNSSVEGVKIEKDNDFCIISDNNIIDNKAGMYMHRSCNNTIEGNTFFDNKRHTIELLVECSNNTISDNTIDHPVGTQPAFGIALYWSSGNNISDNTIENCNTGISLVGSHNNLLSNNTISSSEWAGIKFETCSNNTIIGNYINYNSYYGILIEEKISKNNTIHHNNLVYNGQNAFDEGNNTWDDGEYGNYWSDYEDKYPDAKKKKQENIWDTPYEIPGGSNKDTCPLLKPWPKSVIKTKSGDNSFNLYFPLLSWLLERFPNAFPLIRTFKGLASVKK